MDPTAVLAADPALADLCRRVRFVAFDFDGVLTDNTVVVDQDGRESVRCWRGDGIGLGRLRDAGVIAMVVSTEPNPVVAARCAKLGLPCRQGVADKRAVLDALLAEHGVGWPDAAFVGNDTNDRSCLAEVGLPIVVADAHAEVLEVARYRTQNPGGRGAVREVCDLLVAARREST